MIYIFDTNALSTIIDNYYQSCFPTLWSNFDTYIKDKKIISVQECYNELERYGKKPTDEWIKNHKNIVYPPTSEIEYQAIADISAIPHFQQSLKKENLQKGKPEADIFLIAKAKSLNACLITQEVYKPHSAKIPSICKAFNVEYLNLEGFFQKEKWIF